MSIDRQLLGLDTFNCILSTLASPSCIDKVFGYPPSSVCRQSIIAPPIASQCRYPRDFDSRQHCPLQSPFVLCASMNAFVIHVGFPKIVKRRVKREDIAHVVSHLAPKDRSLPTVLAVKCTDLRANAIVSHLHSSAVGMSQFCGCWETVSLST